MRLGACVHDQRWWWSRERIWAWIVVIAFHVLVFYALTRPVPMPDVENAAMELIFLIPPPTSAPASKSKLAQMSPRPHSGTAPEPAADAVSSEISDDARRVQVVDPPDARAPEPALRVDSDDDWDMPAREAADGLDFKRHPLRSAPDPFGPTRPERFRMRKTLSPRDIVRGVSQLLGFWPPGYTDDPCGGIRQSVEILSMSRYAVPRWQLEAAIEAEQKYCR